jgi:ubiquinone/menaquinone biosynthesis C-methylase UbiE
MAELFSPHASHVTAFDKSPEMLRIARARLQHLPTSGVTLVQGDFTDLPFKPAAFDTVLFHQVLHFAQAPEVVLAQAARVTRPAGASRWSIWRRMSARRCAPPMPMRVWASPMARWPTSLPARVSSLPPPRAARRAVDRQDLDRAAD